jgi:hypothetical protein
VGARKVIDTMVVNNHSNAYEHEMFTGLWNWLTECSWIGGCQLCIESARSEVAQPWQVFNQILFNNSAFLAENSSSVITPAL